MPVRIGCDSCRSDTEHFAKCGDKSYRYCLWNGYSCYRCEFGINIKRKLAYDKKREKPDYGLRKIK